MPGRMKERAVQFLFFSSEWTACYAAYIVAGRIWGAYLAVYALPFLFLLGLFAILAACEGRRVPAPAAIACVVALIALDVGVKAALRSSLPPDRSIELVRPYLSLTNHVNRNGSYLASLLGFTQPRILGAAIPLVGCYAIYRYYRYASGKLGASVWRSLYAILLTAGALCSGIDNAAFGGALDYLSVDRLFIFDTKDLYLTIGLACLLVELSKLGETGERARKGRLGK